MGDIRKDLAKLTTTELLNVSEIIRVSKKDFVNMNMTEYVKREKARNKKTPKSL